MITSIFTDIAGGLGSFVPAFFGAMLEAFMALFIETGTEGALSLTPVGQISLVFIIMGITYKIAPTIVSWLRLGMAKRKKRRARKGA